MSCTTRARQLLEPPDAASGKRTENSNIYVLSRSVRACAQVAPVHGRSVQGRNVTAAAERQLIGLCRPASHPWRGAGALKPKESTPDAFSNGSPL